MLLSEAHISKDALLNNLRFLREAGGNRPTICVVKANAYGHGMIETATVLAPHTEWFAVAQIQEAVALRDAGIQHPILVFAPPLAHHAEVYRRHHITAVVSDLAHFEILFPGTDYHLHMDTGMHRTGLYPEQLTSIQRAMAAHPELNHTGLMTHFATADDPDPSYFTMQLDRFEPMVEALGAGVMVHAANSAAILMQSEGRFDAIRPGISLFGIDPAPTQRPGLTPALTWTSFLNQVKRIRKGERVSYGGRWAAPSDGYYGVVPVGYHDGLMRPLSGTISLLLADRAVPQIGTITMDACMVWLGDQPEAVGTTVTLYDADATQLRSWAHQIDTISYELLCAIGPRVSRIWT